MTTVLDIETLRLARQIQLDAELSAKERNILGQFATPPAMALDIMAHAKALLAPETPIRFLEPAIGSGSFFSALIQTFGTEKLDAAQGFEIDARFATTAKELWQNTTLNIENGDFTKAQAPWFESERFNLVVSNPPYVRHHHLPGAEKERLQHLVKGNLGYQLSQLSGLYCYFQLLAHMWMQEDGLGCWLIPSEFMDVNYGRAVKQYLLRETTLLRIHRYEEKSPQFSDALVSSVVVWFRKTKAEAQHRTEFTYGNSHSKPNRTLSIEQSNLNADEKWTRYNRIDTAEREIPSLFRVHDLFKVTRGLATGDNSFFVLDEQAVQDWGIPSQALRPILPSPRHLPADVVLRDENGNPAIEKPLFLLSPELKEDEIQVQFPALHSYLQEGRKRGIHERYLCRSRSPWYTQEKRPAAPILCTYMGREGDSGSKPFRFILNESGATAANSYLMLYPKEPLKKIAERNPDIYRKIWEQLNVIEVDDLVNGGRTYGGGLHKLEPKELSNIPISTDLHALTSV